MAKIVDLTGMKFGMLTVIDNAGKTENNKYQWLCRCECGNEKIVKSINLRSGDTSSCGCKNNLKGRKFGKLTAIEESGRNKQGGILWLCECDCGNIKTVSASELKRLNVTSCGCIRVKSIAGKKLINNWILKDYSKQRPIEEIVKDYKYLNKTTLEQSIESVESEIIQYWKQLSEKPCKRKTVPMSLFYTNLKDHIFVKLVD